MGYSPEQRLEVRARIESACDGAFTRGVRLDVMKDDPDDNKILGLAAQIGDVIVTGDRQLLRLGDFRGVTIQRPAEFFDELQSRGRSRWV